MMSLKSYRVAINAKILENKKSAPECKGQNWGARIICFEEIDNEQSKVLCN